MWKALENIRSEVSIWWQGILPIGQAKATQDRTKKAKESIQRRINTKLVHTKREYRLDVLPRLLRVCGLTEEKLSEDKNVQKVLDAVDRLAYVGKLPQVDDKHPEIIPGDDAANFIKFLFSDQPLSSSFVSWKLVKALILKKDKEILSQVRKGIQAYLIKLADKLNAPEYRDSGNQQLGKILIGNILSLYPFFEPKDRDTLKIPQKLGKTWGLVDYKLKLLQMTPEWKGDPYYACGFSAVHSHAPSHLVFMGTPPPTTRGVAHAEYTDFVPGLSVGETVYQEGKETIERWVTEEYKRTSRKPNIYGQSLGGALCLILAAHKPKEVGEIFAYNPPSLWDSMMRKFQENVKGLQKHLHPKVNIFWQENDPVSSLGAGWDPSWNVYKVIPKTPHNLYEAHIRAFSGHEVAVVKMTEKDIQEHNASVARRVYNIIGEILRIPFFGFKALALGCQIIQHQATKLLGRPAQ